MLLSLALTTSLSIAAHSSATAESAATDSVKREQYATRGVPRDSTSAQEQTTSPEKSGNESNPKQEQQRSIRKSAHTGVKNRQQLKRDGQLTTRLNTRERNDDTRQGAMQRAKQVEQADVNVLVGPRGDGLILLELDTPVTLQPQSPYAPGDSEHWQDAPSNEKDLD